MSSTFSASQALALWHQVTIRVLLRSGPDLFARQVAVLLTVYLNRGPHTVRGLASDLGVSKPAITRALDRLCAEGLLQRKTDDNDRRSVLIRTTNEGSAFLRCFGATIRETAAGLD